MVSAPHKCFGSGFTDHAPLICSLGRRPKNQNVSDGVPKSSCKNANLKIDMEPILQDIDLSSLPPRRQFPMYKASIKEADRRVKHEMSFSTDLPMPACV